MAKDEGSGISDSPKLRIIESPKSGWEVAENLEQLRQAIAAAKQSAAEAGRPIINADRVLGSMAVADLPPADIA